MKINLGEIELKKKINFGDVKIGVKKVYPKLENIEITPSAEEQIFKHPNSYGYDEVTVKAVETEELTIEPSVEEQVKNGLFGKVTVKPIETEEITINPSTEEQVKEGLFNKVTVKGDSNLIPENIAKGKSIFGVEGNAKTVDMEITNASYLFYGGARTDYINEFIALCKEITNASYMFYNCTALTEIPQLDTSNVVNMSYIFSGCRLLTEIPQLDTSKVTSFIYAFNGCKALTKILELDASKVTDFRFAFGSCTNLVDLGGFKNLGQSYTRTASNYSSYTLALDGSTKLTHESLMNVINNLYDLNLAYNVANGGTLYTQSLVLGSTNLAKLTSSEIAIATNKGWNVT